MISGYLSKILLTAALISILFGVTYGQVATLSDKSPENQNYSIRWVSQYPEVKKTKNSKEKKNNISKILLGEENKSKKSRKNKNWFTNLLFGAKATDLIKPMSVLAHNPDTFWVADQGQGSILNVFNQVGEITQLKNKNIETIPSIVGSCFMPDNKILFTDSKLNKIFQFVPGQKELQIFNDSTLLQQPAGIAYSTVNKQIWVVETKAHRIAILNEKGKLIKHIGTRGSIPGAFNFPTYIWIDQLGMVYVVDAMNFRIQIFNASGDFVSMFGEVGDASGYFARPKGIATDSFGHIYVADAMFHVVQVFDRSGKLWIRP
jgi:hypothetical protein